MEFREWLLNEGAMMLPYKVYKKVVDFYIHAKTQFALSPRKRVPEETIPLDFEGTSYDFLQSLNPKLIVKIRNAEALPEANNAAGVYTNRFKITKEGAIGEIILAAKTGGHAITSIIEHEILHFVQDLIKRYSEEQVAANPNRRDKRWVQADGEQRAIHRPGIRVSHRERERGTGVFKIGGLPNKKILRRILKKYDVDGYVHGTQKARRTTHEYRPVEQMTNLASDIAEKKMSYLERIVKELGMNPLEKTWSDLKSDPEFMKRLGDRKRKSGRVGSNHRKNIDPKAYKFYHKEIFKKFVDSTDWEDTFELLKAKMTVSEKIKAIQQDRIERAPAKIKELGIDLKGYTVEDFGKGVRVKIDYYDRDEFSKIDQLYDPDLEEGEENSCYEAAQEMFEKLGIKESSAGDWDGFSFAVNAQGLKKIFNNIREQKSKESSQIKRCDWDHLAMKVAEHAAYKLSDYMLKASRKEITKEKILDIFYPDPQEECREIS